MSDAAFPTDEQLDKLFEALLPPDEEIDAKTAAIILEREGVDRLRLAAALKSRLERRVEQMQGRGEAIPLELLKVIANL